MNKLKLKNLKTLVLIFCFLIPIFSSLILHTISNYNQENFIPLEEDNIPNDINSPNEFIYSLNDQEYVAEYITKEKVEEMKKKNSLDIKDIDANPIIIDNHGTGYGSPTEEYFNSLIGKISLKSRIQSESLKTSYEPSVDLSEETYFPVVGDQGKQGSCAAWANAYYAYGYLEAKDKGWDASSGNPNYLLSPSWVYNKLVLVDWGSMPSENAKLMGDWGIATLANMPYDDSDINNWGNESAWREAPYHRPLDYTLITYNGVSTIDLIKSLLESGTPVTFGINAKQYKYGLNITIGDFILSSEEYNSNILNHAQCIVGYDDNIIEGSDSGAFRVVNSWGSDWMDDGFFWLTYDAFSEFAGLSRQEIIFLTDRIDYNPGLIATWEFSSCPTIMDDIITLGVGPHDSPLDTIIPFYGYDDYNLFPELMTLDISEFQDEYNLDENIIFFLDIGSSMTTGEISSFYIEHYDSAGFLIDKTYEALNTAVDTPGYALTTFQIFNHESKVSLKLPYKPEFCHTYTIAARLTNLGLNNEIDINFKLYIDGIIVNSSTVSNLLSGSSETIIFTWTPLIYKTYNFTVHSAPVEGEYFTENNIYSKLIPIKLLRNYIMTEAYNYIWIDTSSGTELFLENGDYTIIPLPFDFTFYGETFSEIYLYSNGYLGFVYPYLLPGIDVPFPSSNSKSHYYMIAPFWDDIDLTLGGSIYYQSNEDYWIAEWLDVYHSNGDIIGSFEVILYQTGEIIFNYKNIDYIDPWNGYTCGLNLGMDPNFYNSYQGLTSSINDFSILFKYPSIDHDLQVSLEVPENPELHKSYTITAQVQNVGLNDENDINLYLYYNGIIVVNSTYISNLPRGAVKNIKYTWIPTEYNRYNFTAYSPLITNEIYLQNNIDVNVIYLESEKLFDGLYITHKYGGSEDMYTSNITYSLLYENVFEVNWTIFGERPSTMYWYERVNTRLVKNKSPWAPPFVMNYHTFVRIYTNVKIGDIIPIITGFDGDHFFKVKKELIYMLPGFGSIEVFELEDLTIPGGSAWYEKSTGILLNGTFYFDGGLQYFKFEFLSTNAFNEQSLLLLGDVNNDGFIDIVDALLTAQYYVGLDPTGFHPELADVNADGFIDIVDALLIAQYYVGLIDTFPS